MDISPFTVAEIARELETDKSACLHKYTSKEPASVVLPTCTTAGYSVFKCFTCDKTWKSDSVDMTGHLWDQGKVTVSGVDKAMRYTCTAEDCGARKTVVTEYRVEGQTGENAYLAIPTVTKYFHNAPGAWSMTFDDGNYIDTYEWVVPEFKKRNFKATAVITAQYSGSYTYEWSKYLASGTFDIGSHSQFHTGDFASDALDEAGMMKEIDAAHYIFASWFPGQRILGLAAPNGKTGRGTANMINDLMIGGRSGGQAGHFCDPDNLTTREDWGNLPSHITFRTLTFGESNNVGNNNGVGDIKACIDYVVANGLWSIDCFHTVDTSPNQTTNDKFSLRKETMLKKLDYLADQGLWVGSYTQALQYLREAKAASIENLTIASTSVTFDVTDGLDNCMFIQPLTFKFKLPVGWTNVTVTQNGKTIPMYSADAYNPNMDVAMACTIIDGVLYFDAIPDAGQIVITKN